MKPFARGDPADAYPLAAAPAVFVGLSAGGAPTAGPSRPIARRPLAAILAVLLGLAVPVASAGADDRAKGLTTKEIAPATEDERDD